MNNKYYKQHHKIIHRPPALTSTSASSFSSPILNRTFDSNNANFNNYKTSVHQDFHEYDANLNDYNRRARHVAFDTNSYNHNCCSCNTTTNTNTNSYDAKKNVALYNNKNYYENTDNLIDYRFTENDLKWKGLLPADHYKNLVGPNPRVINKIPTEKVQFNQRVNVKHYVPPSTPPPGDLTIRHEPDIQLPAPPPLYIRQQPIINHAQKTHIFRQNPPIMPPVIPQETLVIPGRVLSSPPRQVIVERLPAKPEPPPNIIIEKWLDYEPQKRKVRYIPPDNNVIIQKPQPNVLIQWDPLQYEVKKEYNDLGVEVADPYEYARKYGLDMADSYHEKHEVELTGDVFALKYLDHDKFNIQKRTELGNNKFINSF